MDTVEYGLSLGSNMGDRRAHLSCARDALAQHEDIAILAQSSIYETEPVDVAEEHSDKPFLNACVIVKTTLNADAVVRVVHAIEHKAGRVRTDDRNAPRPVDIDIIYAGQMSIAHGFLHIPHRHWAERRFVVEPLAEIRPDLVIPGQQSTVAQLLLTLPDIPNVVLLSPDW